MSIFNLIFVLICSIFGAYFVNKILEEISLKKDSKRKAFEKIKSTIAEEPIQEVIDTPKPLDAESQSPERTTSE